jgi:hypothetical protein
MAVGHYQKDFGEEQLLLEPPHLWRNEPLELQMTCTVSELDGSIISFFSSLGPLTNFFSGPT